jgi:surface protein
MDLIINNTYNISLDPSDSYQFNSEDNYTIKIKFGENLTTFENIFLDCSSLKEVDLSNMNTFEIKSMSNMFGGCSSLISVDFGDIDTTLVTSMNKMFSYCYSLSSIDLSKFNTEKVEDSSYMFFGCRNL